MGDAIFIQIGGIETVIMAAENFPREAARYMAAAAEEATKDVILPTEGLQEYPPLTTANLPPPPFYIRGRGLQLSSGRNTMSSERLGTQWHVVTVSYFVTEVANRATYAKWVHGDQQARAMARIGWKKLKETAESLVSKIVVVYEAWVEKLLKDVGFSSRER